MSVGILERVKEFLVRLVKDPAFRTQIQNSTVDERNKVLKNVGYNFSKKEFETAVIKIIESKERGEFNELTEDEMVTVVGGYVRGSGTVQPLYGVIQWWSPIPPTWESGPEPVPPGPGHVQPLYGVVASPE